MGRTAVGAPVGSYWKLMELMPACSKTSPSLAKAESFSNGGRPTELIWGRKPSEQQQPEKRGVRICGRHTDIQVSGEGGQDVLGYQS